MTSKVGNLIGVKCYSLHDSSFNLKTIYAGHKTAKENENLAKKN